MAKGFTKDGKFRPTGNNGSSSQEKSIEPKGMKMMKVLNIEEPLSESSSQRKIEALTEKMSGDVVLTEREINFIKNTLNRTPRDEWKSGEQALVDATWSRTDLEDGFELTDEQSEKGREWLNRKPQRDNMGFRETAVMDDFKEIRLEGIVETHSGTGFYVPVWRVHANDGSTFQYRDIGGELEISG